MPLIDITLFVFSVTHDFFFQYSKTSFPRDEMHNRYGNNKISVEFLKLLLRTVIAAASLAYNGRSETLQFSRTLQTLINCIQLYTSFSNEIRVPIISGFHSNILNDTFKVRSYYKIDIIIITSVTCLSASQTRINSMCQFLIPADVLNDMRTYIYYVLIHFVLLIQGSLYAHVNYVYSCTAIRQRRCSLKSSY